MKVLFVYTNINVRGGHAGGHVAMQLGIASISAMLKEHGHSCDLLLIGRPDWREEVEGKLAGFAPDVIAYTAVATQFPHIARVSQEVRRWRPEVFQICGGPHVTLVPEAALHAAAFDAVCVGEGEYPMLELVEALSRGDGPSGIRNLYYRGRDGEVIGNAIRPFVEDLDALPFFDRDLYAGYVDLGTYPHCIVTTRGCPFNCSYCCNHAFRKLADGRYVRSRSAGNVMAEVRGLQARFPGLGYLYIEDETVGLNRALWDELLPQLKRTGLRFGVNYRIGVTKPDFLDRLADAHFVQVNIGIESGNEWIRRQVLQRRYSNEQIVETFRRARALGMETKAYNLVGLPHETRAMFEDTVGINRLARPDRAKLYIFYPYPGTELEKVCDELGLKSAADPAGVKERTESILELPGFPKDEIKACFKAWKKRTRPPRLWSAWQKARRKAVRARRGGGRGANLDGG